MSFFASRLFARVAITIAACVAFMTTVAWHWPDLAAWYTALPEPVRAALVTGFCTVSAGAIGAAIAFGGVRAANKSSLDRLLVQHKQDSTEAEKQRAFEREQKQEDRKGQIRREVYLGAIEKVNAAVVAPGRLLDRPITDRENEDAPLQDFLTANAKVRLICEAPALALSFEVTSAVAEFYLRGVLLGVKFREQMIYVHKIRADIVEAKEELRRRKSAAEDLYATGERNSQHPQYLAHEERKKHVERLEKGRDEMIDDLKRHRRQFYLDNDEANKNLQLLLARYQSTLREELHLDGNAEQAMASVLEMRERAHKALGLDKWQSEPA
ncbi:MAG: hypothetical protein EOO64_02300 [Massilia sp.]|nr:MAG: hypothetical protein EOO64_02300 [Massilia sp.]